MRSPRQIAEPSSLFSGRSARSAHELSMPSCWRAVSDRAAAFRLFRFARNCSASLASRSDLRAASGEPGFEPSFFIAADLSARPAGHFVSAERRTHARNRDNRDNRIASETVACDGQLLMAVSARVAQSAAHFCFPVSHTPGPGPSGDVCCCRSSVVEHSLGKGEVGSSILLGSTRFLRIGSWPLSV